MAKRCTADMRALDVRQIQRDGCLTHGRTLNWTWSRNGEQVASIAMRAQADRVTLTYESRSYGGEPKSMNYSVRLDRTGCNFGGQRVWWLCPAVGCGRRVAVLYGGAVFACRHCHQLAYRTQREQPHDRAGSKADKLRDRLQWEAGILNGNGRKPKGMHWATFERLQARHDALVNQSFAGIMAKFGPLRELMEG
jgi:hypothetical protein